jgi:phosphotransferase system IIA component
MLANIIKLKSKPARSFALVCLIAVAATALGSTSSSAQLLFSQAAAIIGVATAPAPSAIKAARVSMVLSSALPAVAPQSPSSIMTIERRGHTAARLSDGRVLIAGGENASGALNQSEIYDPTTATFLASGNMSAARSDHSATVLANGNVLIAGGRNAEGSLTTTEIFDPTTGAFASGPAMSVARAGHSATLFADGRVLIAGGDANGSAEVLDLSSDSSNAVGSMNIARSMHSAVLMQDGRVLVVGGRDAGVDLSSGEIFDPSTATFIGVGGMEDARVRPLLRVLFDGKVQIIGGNDHRSLEIYDPAAAIFGAHAHTPPDGDLHADLINELMASPSRAALLTSGQTVTELTGRNQALVTGGVDVNGNATSTTTLYASSGASVTTDALDYPPGTPVIISGRGFQPNEIVDLTFHEDPHVDTDELHTFTVQADASGNFTFDQYSPEEADLGITYILGAKGVTSGWTAQTAFHDGVVNGVTVGTQTGTLLAGSAGSATYSITLTKMTGGASPDATLTIGGLPGGATSSFSPNPVPMNGGGPFNSILTITTTAATPAGTTTFTVSNSTSGVTGTGTLKIFSASTTALSSSLNPSTVGAGVAFSAHLTGSAGTPTGTVTFVDTTTSTTLASGISLNPGGNASTGSITTLTAGSHIITATYSGSTTYGVSSGTLTQVVNAAVPTTLAVSSASGTYGGTVNISATLTQTSGGSPLSGKTINFTLNGGSVGSALTSASGVASLSGVFLTIDGLSSGTRISAGAFAAGVGASFAGDAGFQTSSDTDSLTVNQKALTVIGLLANNKIYDATTTATLSGTASLQSAEATGTGTSADGKPYTGDVVTVGGTPNGTFVSKDVANGIAVTVTGNTISGAQVGNYILTQQTGLSANITPKALTVSGLSASSKIYDATTAATLTGTAALQTAEAPGAGTMVDGKPYTGDTLTIGGTPTGAFASKDVANGIAVTVTGNTISGAQSGNYALTQQSGLTANITPKAVTVTGLTANNKPYDATATATLSGTAALLASEAAGSGTTSDNRPYTGDAVSVTGTPSGTFASINVANGISVSVSGLSLAGGAASNYSLTAPSLSADIMPATVTASIIGDPTKTYDGNASAIVAASNFSLSGLASGESFTVTKTTGTYNSPNVASATTVTTSLLAGDFTPGAGTLASNYTLPTTAGGAGHITAAHPTLTTSGGTFTYDGNAHASTGTAKEIDGTTDVLGSFSYTYTPPGDGTAPSNASATPYQVSAAFTSGDPNYDNGTPATNSITINKATASVLVNGYSGTYDGAAHGASLDHATGVGGADLSGSVNLGGTFTDVTGGTAHWTFSNPNYNDQSGDVAIDIAKASSTTTITCPTNVTYNGSAQTPCSATATGAGSLSASVTVVYGNNTNAGTATADATFGGDTNHNDSTATQVTFTIDRRTLSAAIIGDPTKTYDGNTNATLSSANYLLSTVVASQSITVNKTTGTYNTKDVATANTVSTTLTSGDFTAGVGTNLNNYNLPTSAGGAGHITPKALSITADNKSMLFGGSVPPYTVSYSGFVAGENEVTAPLGGTLIFTVTNNLNVTVTVTSSTPVGTYTIIPSGLTSTNYNITFVNGTLTIGAWTLTGFYQPVDMSILPTIVLNTIKGGSTVPLKFNIFAGTPGPTTERKSTSDVQSFQVAEFNCSTALGSIDSTLEFTTTGGTSLRYDGTAGQFIQNWQAPKPPNKCYQVRMTALDGSHIDAFFKTK